MPGPEGRAKTYFLYNFVKKKGLRDEEYLFIYFEENVEVKDAVELPIIHQEASGELPRFTFLDGEALKDWEKAVYAMGSGGSRRLGSACRR